MPEIRAAAPTAIHRDPRITLAAHQKHPPGPDSAYPFILPSQMGFQIALVTKTDRVYGLAHHGQSTHIGAPAPKLSGRPTMDIATRPHAHRSVALTIAGAIALTPVIVSTPPMHIPTPPALTRAVHLDALVTDSDVAALTANLKSVLAAVGSTATTLAAVPGQTLTGVLNTATGLNTTFWTALVGAAQGSPALATALAALQTASTNGLTQLSSTVGSAGDTISLTTGQVATLLSSLVTGSVGTVVQSVAHIVNNPLALASYVSLLTAPVAIVGEGLDTAISAAQHLGVAALGLTNTAVTGVTNQISNAITLVNNLIGAGQTLIPSALVDGALTAVQGIVTAPLTALLALGSGLSTTITSAASDTLNNVAGGAIAIVNTWLGNTTNPGAVQDLISIIGSNPLSAASYTNAVSVLLAAGGATVADLTGAATSFASLPFRVGANLTTTSVNVVNAFVNGLSLVAKGALMALNLPSFITALPGVAAAAFTGALSLGGSIMAGTLNTIGSFLDGVHSLPSPLAAVTADAATSIPTAASTARTVTLAATTKATTAGSTTAVKEVAESSSSTTQKPAVDAGASDTTTPDVTSSDTKTSDTKTSAAATAKATATTKTLPATTSAPATSAAADTSSTTPATAKATPKKPAATGTAASTISSSTSATTSTGRHAAADTTAPPASSTHAPKHAAADSASTSGASASSSGGRHAATATHSADGAGK